MIKSRVDFGNDGFSVEVVIEKDGDQWCALAGYDLQQGVAGFGNTPVEAVHDFKESFRNDQASA